MSFVPTRTVYVGNIPYSATEETLMQAFSAYEPTHVKVIEGKGVAFIDVPARRAYAMVRDTDGSKLEGRLLSVSIARPRENEPTLSQDDFRERNDRDGSGPPRRDDRPPYRGGGERYSGDRPPRPYAGRGPGDRPGGDRPGGDRPWQTRPRPDGPREDRPSGDRPARPYRPGGDRSDRPYRPPGDRPSRPPYARGDDRPPFRGRGRDFGDRPPFNREGGPPARPYRSEGERSGPGTEKPGDRPWKPKSDRPPFRGRPPGRDSNGPREDRPRYGGPKGSDPRPPREGAPGDTPKPKRDFTPKKFKAPGKPSGKKPFSPGARSTGRPAPKKRSRPE